MDKEPFMEFDLLNLKDGQIEQIEKFHKKFLDVDDILNTASILKYNTLFKKYIEQQFSNPSGDFVKLFCSLSIKAPRHRLLLRNSNLY